MPSRKKRGFFKTCISIFSAFRLAKSGAIPVGTVAHFNLTDCPDGWENFENGVGRSIIGTGKLGNTTYELLIAIFTI